MPFASISLRIEFNDPCTIYSLYVFATFRSPLAARSGSGYSVGREAAVLRAALPAFGASFAVFFFYPTKQAMLSLQRLNLILSGMACWICESSGSTASSLLLLFCRLPFMPELLKYVIDLTNLENSSIGTVSQRKATRPSRLECRSSKAAGMGTAPRARLARISGALACWRGRSIMSG